MYIGRYRVEVMVNHKGEYTKFLLWDRECVELIGQSADEVNRLKIEVCYCIVMQCFLIYTENLLGCYPFSFFFFRARMAMLI